MQQEQFILPKSVTVADPQGNRYVIESVLGKGELGAVYLVRERERTQNVFALKEVINPNKDDRERFAFECEVLKRLNHKALPRVHHVFENDRLKRVYLLMDYIEGRNLEVLRREQAGGRFSLPLALVLLAPIVDALMYLHAQDPPIVHRDIKPANIIVPIGRGEAMLADFGSAKEYVPGTATSLLGRRSPGYAALEQYRSGTNPATDIYGLGATLYALLTGSVPIDAPSRATKILGAGADPLKRANLLVPTVPQAVAEALHRAMAIRVADRFETVEEFWEAVKAPGLQRGPRSTTVDLSQTLPLGRVVLAKDTDPAQRTPLAPRSQLREGLALAAGLLCIVAIEVGLFSYLWGLSVLLFCCLAVLLLSLAVLLHGLFSGARAP
jgi:eukaryotic-like serine/threonine-protein kinase